MTIALLVIDRCARAGIELSPGLSPGKLHYRGPVTPEILDQLRACKAEILAVLKRQAAIAPPPVPGLRLYVGKQSNDKAWSRWPLDDRFWTPMPELN